MPIYGAHAPVYKQGAIQARAIMACGAPLLVLGYVGLLGRLVIGVGCSGLALLSGVEPRSVEGDCSLGLARSR
jgi:hypothetical protein